MSAVKSIIKYNYDMMLLKDYLKERIKDAGFSHADISKTPTGTKVALHVTRPGIVIGRKGVGIRELTDTLAAEFDLKNPQLAVVEITEPELYPSVMCNRMASHLERGTAFRRATMWTLKQIMESGAMGVQITISGKLRGDRSAFEKHTAGVLPRAGHHAEVIVDEDTTHVNTPMGLIGIRIRIAIKKKMIPEFEMKPVKSDKSKKHTNEDDAVLTADAPTDSKKDSKPEKVAKKGAGSKKTDVVKEDDDAAVKKGAGSKKTDVVKEDDDAAVKKGAGSKKTDVVKEDDDAAVKKGAGSKKTDVVKEDDAATAAVKTDVVKEDVIKEVTDTVETQAPHDDNLATSSEKAEDTTSSEKTNAETEFKHTNIEAKDSTIQNEETEEVTK